MARATDAERQVADLIPIDTDPETAADVLERVPIWFHTFALNRSQGIYTHGVARDHRYRIPALPEDFSGLRVLDIGTFDGFYAVLAEVRGAARVVAVDNEQYKEWISSRWGVELDGGEGFVAIRQVLGSEVEYRHLDAFELRQCLQSTLGAGIDRDPPNTRNSRARRCVSRQLVGAHSVRP